jgi:hypothetical protein
VYVCSLIAREGIHQFVPDLACLFLETGKRFWLVSSKLRKKFLGLSPGEGGFSSSETMHETRMVPRTKSFTSARRLQKKRHNRGKQFLGSSPGEDGFCTSETNDGRTQIRQNCLLRRKD